MAQHYPKNTVQASDYCNRCRAVTMHTVASGRIGSCMVCIAKLGEKHAAKKPEPKAEQRGLFGGAA